MTRWWRGPHPSFGFALLTVVAYVVLLGALVSGRRDETPATGALGHTATMER